MNLAELGYAVGSGCLASLAPTVFKKQGPAPERQMSLLVAGNFLALLTAGALLLEARGRMGGWPFLALGAAAGFFATVNVYTYGSLALHRGPVSISWSVVYLTAVTVPALGWLLLREPILFWQPWGLLCIALCLGALALAARRTALKRGGEFATKKGFWLWLSVALAAGTGFGFLTKVQGMVREPGHIFSFMLASYAVATAGLYGLSRVRADTRPVYDRRTWGLAVAFAIVYPGAMFLLLKGLQTAPLSELVPVQSGAAIIAGLIIARLSGERPSRLAYVGALLAIAAIVFVNLGGRELRY